MLNVAIGNIIFIITQKLITIRKDEARQITCIDSDTIFWGWTGVCWILSFLENYLKNLEEEIKQLWNKTISQIKEEE